MALRLPKRDGLIVPQIVQPIDVEAWTERATESLHGLSTSPPVAVRGTSSTLAISLDEHPHASDDSKEVESVALKVTRPARPVREPIRRDSLKRREALLKGKEGSRARRRYDNDRLLDNPWAQPPLPIDWEVHPTHPKRTVPYFLAPLWDVNGRVSGPEKQSKAKGQNTRSEDSAQRAAKELRQKLKRAKAAKGLLQDLEKVVRSFVEDWEKKEPMLKDEGLQDIDSEDDEIVFVGRTGQMLDLPPPLKAKQGTPLGEISKEKLVFDSPATDHGASFGRWLVHSIATYYGLHAWSVTVGNPARREAYVGIKQMKTGTSLSPSSSELPRPLWCMV